MIFYVYLLRSVNTPEQTYIGFTENVENRVKYHNNGGAEHTYKFKPWILIAFFAFDTKMKALSFEKYLKSDSGRAFANKRFW